MVSLPFAQPRQGGTRRAVTLAVGLAVSLELIWLLLGDIEYIAGKTGKSQSGPQGQRHFSGSGSPASSSLLVPLPLPPPPKVALLFLTRGPLPAEPLWRLFLDSATAALQQQGGGTSSRLLSAGRQHAQQPPSSSWQLLFSLYVHSPPGFRYPRSSLFTGREVPDEERVEVKWGQHSVVEGERALLRAGLRDPLNLRFVLLSDSCIPLYSAPLVYGQLMSENRSRIDACKNPGDKDDQNRRMEYRWQAAMAAFNVSRQQWRKSSQWFMLTRRDAEVVANDTRVAAAFQQECWVADDHSRFCVSDEHYIPTLLAVNGLDGDVECQGVITFTRWDGPYFHPKTFGRGEASAQVLQELRGGCNSSNLAAGEAGALVTSLLRPPGKSEVPGGSEAAASSEGAGLQAAPAAVAAAGLQHPLPPRCPLFARKVSPDSIREWVGVLKPVMRTG